MSLSSLKHSCKEVTNLLLRPGTYDGQVPSLRLVLLTCGVLLLTVTIVLTICAFAFSKPSPLPSGAEAAAQLYTENISAVEGVLFAGGWIMYAATAPLFRFLWLVILGDRARVLRELYTISLVAMMPMVIAGAVLRCMGIAMYDSPPSAWLPVLALAVFLSAAAFEGWVCVSTFKSRLGQNTGRAVITWISPLVTWTSLLYVLISIVDLIAG